MHTSLLTTKFSAPPARPERIARPRLIERLNKGMDAGLTLVSAPAGYGKTTLIADWGHLHCARPVGASVADCGSFNSLIPNPQVCWLSLDEGDNDPTRFFTYLLAALQGLPAKVGQTAHAMLQSPQPPPAEALLTSLINDLAAVPQPFVLVLDDYHVIHSLLIHQQLGFLLEHRPAPMSVVIATREDPPLPLARLRARGQIVEIRQADLGFTAEETAAFLRRAARVSLTPGDVAALHQRTEGWIAGLQLAALSMQGQADAHRIVASFTGSHRFVLDYLLEEVFQRQPPAIQDFLLHTAILERMCGGLCDAVTSPLTPGRQPPPLSSPERSPAQERREGVGESGVRSQEILDHLDRANLFVIPLDPERGWYRYHHLFAELLRHRLQIALGDRVGLLHRRASAWYAAQGFLPEAVQHALAAQDWEQAAALIQASSDALLKRGEVITLLNWLQALPDDLVRSRPQLRGAYSWALILTGQLDAAEAHLSQAEAAAQDDPALLGDILSTQAYIARARGDNRRGIALSERILALVPPDAFAERSIAALNVGIARFNSGDLTRAAQALAEAKHAAHQIGAHYPGLIAQTILGVIQASWGRLRQAAELFQQTIRSAGDSPAAALAHLELGALLYEWNELAAATDHLQRGLELSQRGGNAEVEIGGYRTLARLKQAQGDASASLKLLEQAHQYARDHHLPTNMRARSAACHVQIALTQGDLSMATQWAAQVTDDADPNPFYPLLNLTQPACSWRKVKRRLRPRSWRSCTKWRRLRAGLSARWRCACWQAVATLSAPTADRRTNEVALEFLADALQRGQPERFIRTFADAGEALVPLLQDAARRGIAPGYVGEILAAIGAKTGTPTGGASSLIEPLSERELEVLRLLASGLSNRAIAEKLILSEGTVKTHLHHISGKLGAANRTEAAAIARKLNLV